MEPLQDQGHGEGGVRGGNQEVQAGEERREGVLLCARRLPQAVVHDAEDSLVPESVKVLISSVPVIRYRKRVAFGCLNWIDILSSPL